MSPRELPIIFTAESVRAILSGKKTQTRRLISGERWERHLGYIGPSGEGADPENWGFWVDDAWGRWAVLAQGLDEHFQNGRVSLPSRYRVGDALWIRETWRTEQLGPGEYEEDSEIQEGVAGVRFRSDCSFRVIENSKVASDAWIAIHRRDEKWRSPLFMPRWASRLELEVTDVRPQRLQDISEEDAKSEGVNADDAAIVFQDNRIAGEMCRTHRGAYACEWDRINRKRALFADNPWVWAISFRKVKP